MKRSILSLGVTCALLVSPLQAAEDQTSVPASTEPGATVPTSTEPTAFSAGMRVYIDPATGRLSPVPVTDEQRRLAERPLEEAESRPMTEFRLADGTVGLNLNGNFEMASQLVVGSDGKRYRLCTDVAHLEDAAHIHPADAAVDVSSDEY